ncbi:MAG: hypothetical protein ABW185_23510 [Sedimenticola sp.]
MTAITGSDLPVAHSTAGHIIQHKTCCSVHEVCNFHRWGNTVTSMEVADKKSFGGLYSRNSNTKLTRLKYVLAIDMHPATNNIHM